MPNKVVVLASILKPLDDTRMYEKLGLSIRESNKYRVNIIGFGTKKPALHPDITFHTIYRGKRLGFGRLIAPWKFLLKLVSIGPSLVIVCTPELLLPATIYKLIHKARLWYDIQENYSKNVQFQSAYHWLAKPLLRIWLWVVNTVTYPAIDHFILAEQGYVQELNFTDNYTVLENKAKVTRSSVLVVDQEPVELVFTGTHSIENGVLEAIALAKSLHYKQFPVRLTLVGQVPDKKLLQLIENKIESYRGRLIQLLAGLELVPHQEIMAHASKSHFGLVAHQPNPSNEHCIPTKIYEYLGLQLPMLLQSHPLWRSAVDPYQAALVFDYKRFQPEILWKQMKESSFYTTLPGPEVCWESEESKLLRIL